MIPLMVIASIGAMASAQAAQPASASAARNAEFLQKHYPPEALKRGEQGRVAFNLTIDTDGSIIECDVTESSGVATLDRETCNFMVIYARPQPVRDADGRRIRVTRPGSITWLLPAGVTHAAVSHARTMPKPEKLICGKRDQAIGSLVMKRKQCLTKAEWLRQEEMWRQEMDRLRGGHTG